VHRLVVRPGGALLDDLVIHQQRRFVVEGPVPLDRRPAGDGLHGLSDDLNLRHTEGAVSLEGQQAQIPGGDRFEIKGGDEIGVAGVGTENIHAVVDLAEVRGDGDQRSVLLSVRRVVQTVNVVVVHLQREFSQLVHVTQVQIETHIQLGPVHAAQVVPSVPLVDEHAVHHQPGVVREIAGSFDGDGFDGRGSRQRGDDRHQDQ